MLSLLFTTACKNLNTRYSAYTMGLLVDTWNVLHQMGVLPPDLAGLGVGELASLLSKGRWNRDRISLVCDGTPPPDGSNLG